MDRLIIYRVAKKCSKCYTYANHEDDYFSTRMRCFKKWCVNLTR